MTKHAYFCSVEDCTRSTQEPGAAKGLCPKHYQMFRTHGRTTRVYGVYGKGHVNQTSGYVETYDDRGRKTYEHIQIAERALGRPLPHGAVVHHITEDRADNHGPFKLVICPDQKYHSLIHRLMREKNLSGHTFKRDD